MFGRMGSRSRPHRPPSAWDGARAVGFLLLDSRGHPNMRGVTQYGLERRSPVSAAEVWTAQRSATVRLLPGRSDVQLLLTAPPQAGPVTWTFVAVRAATVAQLRTRADAVIAELFAN